MQTWDDGKGYRNISLLNLRRQFDALEDVAPYLYYLNLFDEPHTPGGGDRQDLMRAFLLEANRPDLLASCADGEVGHLPLALQSEYRYVNQKALGELSNWVMRICRSTLQRQFPDLRLWPMTFTMYGPNDAFDLLDSDGDYSWRYDYDNLFGHYGKGAVLRALHPGQPACMVTWMGWLHPNMAGEEVCTDVDFPDGPWLDRGYMGTRSALALYASGMEAGMFNSVAYKPIAERGLDTRGGSTFPLTPYSPALDNVIRHEMMGGDSKYWTGVKTQIEMEVMKTAPNEVDVTDNGDTPALNVQDDELKLKAKRALRQGAGSGLYQHHARVFVDEPA